MLVRYVVGTWHTRTDYTMRAVDQYAALTYNRYCYVHVAVDQYAALTSINHFYVHIAVDQYAALTFNLDSWICGGALLGRRSCT